MLKDNGLILPNKDSNLGKKTIDRREVLKHSLSGLLAASVPLLVPGEASASRGGSWHVSFMQKHTGERYSGVYRVGDKYLPEAFEQMNFVLRDHRTGEIFPMDPHLIDIVSMLQRKTGYSRPFEILSGYRSPHTNASLRRNSSGVARNSYHMYGQAMDIRAPGLSTRTLRDRAKGLRAGGVGYYSRSNFVHVDTGDVRSW